MTSGPPQASEFGYQLPAEAAPAYNEATGTLDVNQAGLSTRTQISNDGRVEIRIDEIDTRLTQQLQQIQLSSQAQTEPDTSPAPSYLGSYTNSSHGRPPLPLNIVIHVVGSRGDVQPFVALGRVLKRDYGHRIRLATHGTFKKFVEENGLEFFDIGGDPAELMAFMVKNPGLIPGMKSLKAGDVGKRRKGMAEIIQGCWRSCADADELKEDGDNSPAKLRPFIANAIIANPPSFAHIHCAEKLGIPLHLMFTMPWSPTKEFPHPLANIKSSNTSRSMSNEMSYTLVDMMTWQGLGDIINKFRSETLDLRPLTQAAAISDLWMDTNLLTAHVPSRSPTLIPKPKDWGPNIDISGFYFLSLASNYQPAPELAEFLAAGPPPVYIGFGSIVVDDPDAMTDLIFGAIRKTGQRALVSKGWGGLGGDKINKPDGVFMLGNCPHDWLFKHVSCVVHHGGAGTMAAGIALGRPTVIVPFFGDQPFWGAMVARAGAGPPPISFKELTTQGLADAILYALKPETLGRARELGDRIHEEKGCEAGATSFHSQMDIDRLRCMLAPNRPAVWLLKTKTRGVCLSAFAATVLGNEGIIDLNQLVLYRPYEYAVDESFTVSNFSSANPILSTVGSYTSGLLHLPVSFGRAWAGVVYEPYKGAKAAGWKGLGKGLGKGVGNLFPKRGLFTYNGKSYGLRPLYDSIRKRMGGGTLSFILAAHFAQGFEEASKASGDERSDVLARWQELAPELKKKGTGISTANPKISRVDSRSTGSTLMSESSNTLGVSWPGPSTSGP